MWNDIENKIKGKEGTIRLEFNVRQTQNSILPAFQLKRYIKFFEKGLLQYIGPENPMETRWSVLWIRNY